MGCTSSKQVSQSGVVKLVSVPDMNIPNDLYFSSPIKTNINLGKSKIIKFNDGLF